MADRRYDARNKRGGRGGGRGGGNSPQKYHLHDFRAQKGQARRQLDIPAEKYDGGSFYGIQDALRKQNFSHVSEARTFLLKLLGPGFNVKYEDPDKTKIPTKEPRVIITVARNSNEFNTEISKMAGSIIMEYPTWKFLSLSPPEFNPRIKKIPDNIDEYWIYAMEVGTIVTLYYYEREGGWRISTINNYDITDCKWIGPKTYKEALEQVLKNHPEFSFDQLNKSFCYTIGFTFADYHLLSEKEHAWYIQSWDLSDQDNIACSEEPMKTLPQQAFITNRGTGKKLIEWMNKMNDNAIEAFANSKGKTDRDIHLGFIIRSDDNDHAKFPSTLYSVVEKMVYGETKKTKIGVILNETNRLDYIILRAALHPDWRKYFIRLFPALKDKFNKVNKFLTNVAKLVNNLSMSPKNEDMILREVKGDTRDDIKAKIVARDLFQKFRDRIRTNTYGPDSASIVNDFVINDKHLAYYFTIIQK